MQFSLSNQIKLNGNYKSFLFLSVWLVARPFITTITAAMAEWLRRWTRNPMGSSRVGSNPTHSEIFILSGITLNIPQV